MIFYFFSCSCSCLAILFCAIGTWPELHSLRAILSTLYLRLLLSLPLSEFLLSDSFHGRRLQYSADPKTLNCILIVQDIGGIWIHWSSAPLSHYAAVRSLYSSPSNPLHNFGLIQILESYSTRSLIYTNKDQLTQVL